jgi:hypothetical protein
MKRRWVIERTQITPERDYLQVCIVMPEEVNKEELKKEHKHFYKRYVISGT